jgi:hypothetical protein
LSRTGEKREHFTKKLEEHRAKETEHAVQVNACEEYSSMIKKEEYAYYALEGHAIEEQSFKSSKKWFR